jgi:hypothetical protein
MAERFLVDITKHSSKSQIEQFIEGLSDSYLILAACRMEHAHVAGCQCVNEDVGEKFSLYRFVNTNGLRALNAVDPSMLAHVLRPENEKQGHDNVFVESDDDDTLLLVIPFIGSVRLRKIIIRSAGEECPTEVRLFKNLDVGFDNVEETKPTQVLRLGPDPEAELELSVVAPKFNDCRQLSFYFPESVGGDKSRVYFIGLLGDYIPPQDKLVGVVYEANPQLKDHQTRADQMGSSNLGM